MRRPYARLKRFASRVGGAVGNAPAPSTVQQIFLDYGDGLESHNSVVVLIGANDYGVVGRLR
jgi:hypothetical protein